MKKVIIPTKLDGVALQILEENGNYEVVQDEKNSIDEIVKNHPDTYAMIVRSEKITPDVIDALPSLKVVVRAGAGFNTIDTKYARKKGIDVMNTPGANSNAVAEEVIAMILADARHVLEADPSTRSGKWEKKKFMGRELSGKTLGIIGLGNIGQLLARRLSGFDMKLLGYDPFISTDRAKDMSVILCELETIFSESDYISLHIPETDETKGLVGSKLLSLIKDGATIINCARAGIVNNDDLRAVRKEKNIRFLNDVYSKDAEGEKDVANIADLMLPHLGASTKEANYNAAKRAAEQLIDLDAKGITSFIVNRDIPDGLDEAYCELSNIIAKLARCLIGKQTRVNVVETSFYGTLEPFAEWLLVPITAGISDDFDRSMDHVAARKHMEEMGVEYVNRKLDPNKKFENSITIDLIGQVDSENMRRMSIRGTYAEGVLMISRINEFDKLYFEPVGNTVFFLYEDRPGVIGLIGSILAENEINIEDMRNPHDNKTNRSLAIMKVNKPVPEQIMQDIEAKVKTTSSFSIKL